MAGISNYGSYNHINRSSVYSASGSSGASGSSSVSGASAGSGANNVSGSYDASSDTFNGGVLADITVTNDSYFGTTEVCVETEDYTAYYSDPVVHAGSSPGVIFDNKNGGSTFFE